MDNLNTPDPASFYEVFEPDEAWRLSQKVEIHHIPVHGSWLNIINEEATSLCESAQIAFTRGRPGQKRDQCFVEHKHGAIVCHIVGYERFVGELAWLSTYAKAPCL